MPSAGLASMLDRLKDLAAFIVLACAVTVIYLLLAIVVVA